MFIATGTDGGGKKIIFRAKKDMMLFEVQDGQSHFYQGVHMGNIQMSLDKETNIEKILFSARNQWDKFPVGTFESIIKAIHGFEYEKLVPDTNITVSAFEKMKKEADELKKEVDRLKTPPVKTIKKSKVIKNITDKQEVDLLGINQT
jgi:hypothetical protein